MNDHLDNIEKEFSTYHENNNKTENKPSIIRYLGTIVTYLLYLIIPTILVTIIVAVIPNKDLITTSLSSQENSIHLASRDLNSFLLIKPGYLDGTTNEYNSSFISVYKNEEFEIYIHSQNTFYKTDTAFDEVGEGIYYLNETGLNEILTTTKTKWANNSEIKLYSSLDTYPEFILNSTLFTNSNYIESAIYLKRGFSEVFSFILYFIFTSIVVIILKPNLKLDYLQFKKVDKALVFSKTSTGVLLIFAGNIVALFITTFYNEIFKITQQTSANQASINSTLGSIYAPLIIILAVIIAPIIEELVFRKAVFGLIKNPKLALIVSSVVFGLIHITTELSEGKFLLAISLGISYVAGGIVLGYIYIQNNKNIYINILVHGAYNLISVLLSYLAMLQ